MNAMKTPFRSRSQQSGAYLLEALIGILIFSLGVLGIVGLQAAALRTTTDNSLRSEAVFAATQIMGQMWSDVQNGPGGQNGGGAGGLISNYSSAGPGPTYVAWAADLKGTQGGAWVSDPVVSFADLKCLPAPDPASTSVFIQINWQSPDGGPHNYATCGLIGMNTNNS